ncbi:hypothetical protein CCHL11_00998 [Colletotrichum chlorophyti]|uniref:Uncharacterized protein n=1 Tax=Colletotrichum chlorophyti TaxID=708187 RepID=A0A1Q8S826_9PEZI|nr:hypothetical protein CCHL11_00998 [Colletotrichum chlorophyti]
MSDETKPAARLEEFQADFNQRETVHYIMRRVEEPSPELRQALNLIKSLTSEVEGQQAELRIMKDKMLFKRKSFISCFDGIARAAKNEPENLLAEIEDWRRAMIEWDWADAMNDRTHEIGTLLDLVSAAKLLER